MQAGTEVVSRRSPNDSDEWFGLRLGLWVLVWGLAWSCKAHFRTFPASQTNYGHDLTWALRGKAAPTAGQAISICVINEMCARSPSLAPNAKELRKAFP